MKTFIAGLVALFAVSSAQADFFGGDDGEWKMGPYGPYWEESDWPKWTPMYWMEEMMDSFDDDDDNFGSFGGFPGNMPMMGGNNNVMPGFGNQQYRMPAMPYGQGGYTTPMMPMPQAPVAPMPPQGNATQG